MKTIILYHTTDGQTAKIVEFINQKLTNKATLINLREKPHFDIGSYDLIIIGASIRYGKHNHIVVDFIKQNLPILQKKQTVFFSVNLVARKANKNTPDTNIYVKKLLANCQWQPDLSWVFAGKINYPIYGFWDKQIIRFIMWMTKGPVNSDCVHEYTNWQSVEKLAEKINNWQ